MHEISFCIVFTLRFAFFDKGNGSLEMYPFDALTCARCCLLPCLSALTFTEKKTAQQQGEEKKAIKSFTATLRLRRRRCRLE
jgi:hypothetical protein